MRFYDPDFFLNCTLTYEDANKAALTADKVLSNNAVCLWGKHDGRNYYDLTSYPKAGDHIKIIGVAPKRVKPLRGNYDQSTDPRQP